MRLSILLSAALALAGCAHGPRSAQRFWPGEGRCYRDGGDRCREPAWAALRGQGAPADDRAAAAFLMLGCETGGASTCADLAALHAAGRGVRRDDGRACELGLAEACQRAGRPAPAVGREPTAALPAAVPASPVAPADLAAERIDIALEYAQQNVDGKLLGPLAMTHEALLVYPPAPEEDLATVRPLMAARRKRAEACLPVIGYTRLHGPDEPGPPPPDRVPARAWATFILDTDGRVTDVRARAVGDDPEAPAWQRCLEETIARWEFPLPREGGRLWIRLVGTGAEVVRPTTGEPLYAAPEQGFVRPAQRQLYCVERNIRLPERYMGSRWKPAVVQFAVYPDGSVRRFHTVKPELPDLVATAISDAVHGCEWIPGRGPGGAEVPAWVVLWIRFVPG